MRNRWPDARSVVALLTTASSTSPDPACRPVGERQLPSEWWKGTAVNAIRGDDGPTPPYAEGRRELTDALEDRDLNAVARDRPSTDHPIWIEPYPRRVRAFLDDVAVVDSTRALLLEAKHLPVTTSQSRLSSRVLDPDGCLVRRGRRGFRPPPRPVSPGGRAHQLLARGPRGAGGTTSSRSCAPLATMRPWRCGWPHGTRRSRPRATLNVSYTRWSLPLPTASAGGCVSSSQRDSRRGNRPA
jgi:hypothetical protein